MNLEKFISDYRRNPLNFVRREFQTEPDAWQKEVLSLWADPAKQRIALVACKGPGKTAVLAWLVWQTELQTSYSLQRKGGCGQEVD